MVFWKIHKGDSILINDCNFQLDAKDLYDKKSNSYCSNLTEFTNGMPEFINIGYSFVLPWWNNNTSKPHNLNHVTITNSTFKETGYNNKFISDPETYNYGKSLNKNNIDRFKLIPSGIQLDYIKRADINNNVFDKINIALQCDDVTDLSQASDNISNSMQGTIMKSTSASLFCNIITNTKTAIYNEGSGSNSFNNNSISAANFGFDLNKSSADIYRNTITLSKYGVVNLESYSHLGGSTNNSTGPFVGNKFIKNNELPRRKQRGIRLISEYFQLSYFVYYYIFFFNTLSL